MYESEIFDALPTCEKRDLWVALIKQHKIVFEKRRSFGYAVPPFCKLFSKDTGSIPTRP